MKKLKVGDIVVTNEKFIRALTQVCSDPHQLRGTIKRVAVDGLMVVDIHKPTCTLVVHPRFLEKDGTNVKA